jgi:predicted aconitase
MVCLTRDDAAMLDGRHGPAARLAMSIVVKMAEVRRAGELLDITQAHIDSALYIGESTLEFAEHLVDLGARVAVPTTLNVSGLDEHGWRDWPVPADWAAKAHRQMVAYQRMGCTPTWTCAPYQTEARPHFGQQIAWGESNAIAFANSVIGARTERYPDLFDICCAIAGRAPAVGLHLTEHRAARLELRLAGVPREVQADEPFYPVLGSLMGALAGDRVPVLTGLEVQPAEDQLKALAAAGASTGRLALFHIAGVTPEAPTLEDACHEQAPEETIEITMPMLREARRRLTSAGGGDLDLVALGSPHMSVAELRQLVPLLAGRHAHPRVGFLVTTSRLVRDIAEQTGLAAPLAAFGGRVTVDTCILTSPMLPPDVRTLMTNSAKYAYYAPGLLGTHVVFGSLADCVASAVAGRVIIDESRWNT